MMELLLFLVVILVGMSFVIGLAAEEMLVVYDKDPRWMMFFKRFLNGFGPFRLGIWLAQRPGEKK